MLPRGGAAVDHDASSPEEAAALGARWLAAARALAEAHGLGTAALRVKGAHVTLALDCSPEHRMAAADALDLATGAEVGDLEVPPPDPAVRACFARADALGLPWFVDEHGVTVGTGRRSTTWRWRHLPFPEDEPVAVKRGPVVLVTGTNGKTTTANLLGAIAWADGWLPGVATSAGVRIGRDEVERGDWSGAEAARRVMRDPEVNFAVLETARGGILRRGVLVEHADVAVITNVTADHLGEGGIDTVEELCAVKATVAAGLRPGGAVVIPAGDPVLEAAVAALGRPDLRVLRFDARGDGAPADGRIVDGWLVLGDDRILGEDGVPLALRGAARHNLENALAAALAARATGIGDAAIAEGLRALRPAPEDNPGRGNLFEVRGATVLVEYAHNPAAFEALRAFVSRWPARRRALLLGQAGDRTEAAVADLARAAAALGCERIVLKPLPGYARGRDPAATVALLHAGLLAAGVDPARIDEAPTESAGLSALLAWAEPGDLVLGLVHEDLAAAVALLREAARR